MAIRKVSGASQLKQALSQAGGGDTIKLSGGNYGALNLSNFNKAVTIESDSGRNPATFSTIKLNKSANVTLDSLEFAGRGGGVGVQIKDSRNITIEDSDFARFYKGITANDSHGIKVIKNLFTAHTEDAMAFSGVHGLLVSNNKVDGMRTNGGAHKDMIQLHGGGGSGPSSNVVIRDNTLISKDGNTQAIYIGNSNGGPYRNITIDDNNIISGHHHGISVARTEGLRITNNSVLKDGGLASKGVHVPKINVDGGSRNVVITNNTAHDVPNDRGGWQVSNNKIVSPGTKAGSRDKKAGISDRDDRDARDGGSFEPEARSNDRWDDSSDTFRFDGDAVRGWTKGKVRDFDDGDEIRLDDYETGTFKGWGKGVQIRDRGQEAVIDDYDGLEKLIARSKDVDAVVWKGKDVLVLRIEQSDGVHAIQLHGIDDPMALI